MATERTRTTVLAATAFLLGTIAAGSGSLRAAWDPIARFISLEDPPSPASANVLSEHEIAVLHEMLPQSQAELLLERSINHYRGANEQISARVDSWRGHITLNERLNNLFVTAINSDDLTVRVAGVEVDIAARNLTKDSATVDRLEAAAREGEQGPRANALWDLALIGNRGVSQDRILDILLASIHDDNVNVRYWAVEGLAYLAVDGSIEPLLDIFHDDPSPMIRERGVRAGAVGDVQRGTAPEGGAAPAGLRDRWRARRRHTHVGVSGAARYYRPGPPARCEPLERLVQDRKITQRPSTSRSLWVYAIG